MKRFAAFLIVIATLLASCESGIGGAITPPSNTPTTEPPTAAPPTDTPPSVISEAPTDVSDVVQSDEPPATETQDVPASAFPSGTLTGNTALDDEVAAIISEVCDPDGSESDNLWAVFNWMVKNLTYKGIAVDLSNGYTDDLVHSLAETLVLTLRGSCEHQAALMCIFARRLGLEAEVVAGEFLDDDGATWVEHAWVIAKTEGGFRHFDVLFGRNHTGGNPRSMFWQTDASIVRHRWNSDDYPACE